MKNKNMSFLALAIVGMFLVTGFVGLSVNADASEEMTLGSSGVPSDAIAVSNAADLARIGTYEEFDGHTWTMDAYYYLTRNITLTGVGNHTPIGTGDDPFTGTFNGRGFKITGMNITTSVLDQTEDKSGMFGLLTGATISNLFLSDLTINVSATANYIQAGGIAGGVRGGGVTIENCGIVGNSSITANSDFMGVNAGGLIGINHNGLTLTITDSFNTADITVTAQRNANIGGISSGATTVMNCYNTGNITATAVTSYVSIGGILSTNNESTVISNCYNTGNIQALVQASATSEAAYIGGILGNANGGTIKDCYNTGNLSLGNNSAGISDIGGITGRNGAPGVKVSNCYNTGSINLSTTTGASNAGGILGRPIGVNYFVNVYYLAGQITINGIVVSDRLTGTGTPSVDGTSDPARLTTPNQTSGAATIDLMIPDLIDAQNNLSIYYTGTTTNAAGTFAGWDFFDTWTMDDVSGLPTLIGSPVFNALPDTSSGGNFTLLLLVILGLLLIVGILIVRII